MIDKHDLNVRIYSFLLWLAGFIPRRLAGWVFVRVTIAGCSGVYSNQEVPALTCADALRRWLDAK